LQRLALPGVLAVVVVVAFIMWSAWTHGPALEVPIPQDLDNLEPQLRLYIREKVKWVRQAPSDDHRRATLGMVYSANSIWPEARIAFQNAASLNPKEPLSQLYLAVATQEMGDFGEALKLYRQVTVRFPDFAQGYYRLGDSLLRAGTVDEAENAFRRLIILAPQEWRGFAGLGDVKLRQGDWTEAAKQLERAIQIDPNAKVAHHLLGLAYRGLGRLDEARRELRVGLNAINYPMPDAWSETAAQHMKLLPDQFELADGYSEKGQPNKAVELLEKALLFQPEDLSVMDHLAIAYTQAGQPEKARTLLLHEIQIDKNHVPTYITLSACCRSLDLNDQALTYASRAVELAPNLAQTHLALANVFLALERDAAALSEMESALRCDPQNVQIEMEIADVCWRNLGQPAAALEHYQRVIQLDPGLVEVHVRLAEMQLRLGDVTGAQKAIEDLRKLSPAEPALAVLEDRLRKQVKR
jgi:tetratricopeptide (TPR) repeat protein